MAQVVWSRRAERCVREIRNYIAQHNPQAADHLVDAIHRKVTLLEDVPGVGYLLDHERWDNVRVLLQGHYRIVYRIRSDDLIEIVAVYHGRMDVFRHLPPMDD